MVDIHSHILPEVDDGPKSWEAAVAMCLAAASDGITDMVASPHANDRFHYHREYLQGMLAELQSRIGSSPRLHLGCDFHLSYDNLQDAYEHPDRYVIGKTRYLLVEFSNYSVPQQTSETFRKLANCGITPVITHPERNPILRETLHRVAEWAEQGCVIQITGSSLTGFWGERARRAALWLLEHQAAHVLATDAHDTEKRVPILSRPRQAAADIVGAEIATSLVETNPRAIITNLALPYFPEPVISSYRKN